jgi:hypothetical protein
VSHTNESGSNSTRSHESAESSRKRKEKVSRNKQQHANKLSAVKQKCGNQNFSN